MRFHLAEVQDKSLQELQELLAEGAKEARLVTLQDLASVRGAPCTGVYVFFEGKKAAYVGKASSRAFIERVPSHFDTRVGSWFGTLVQRVEDNAPAGLDVDAILRTALNLRVALLFIEERDTVDEVERCLRHAFGPTFNTPKRRRAVNMSRTLGDVIESGCV